MSHRRIARRARWLALAAGLALAHPAGAAGECAAPKVVVTTVVGIKYCVDPAFDPVVQEQARKIRADVQAQRQAQKLIVYASTPISPRGGGHVATNLAIAASVKTQLEREYGAAVWVLDPGRYQLPAVAGKSPGGSEYMVMWTAVLAGDDGSGPDFDMVHFTGPGNMRAFFGCGLTDVAGCIDGWVTARAAVDAKFRQEVVDPPGGRARFVRYYALRASSAYSTGAHDEWNIMVAINRRRPLGEQVAMYFDGRPLSPGEMETTVSPGYELR